MGVMGALLACILFLLALLAAPASAFNLAAAPAARAVAPVAVAPRCQTAPKMFIG